MLPEAAVVMGTDIKKQYLLLKNKPIMYYSLKTFEESPVDDIILVVPNEDIDYCKKELVLKVRDKKDKSRSSRRQGKIPVRRSGI